MYHLTSKLVLRIKNASLWQHSGRPPKAYEYAGQKVLMSRDTVLQ